MQGIPKSLVIWVPPSYLFVCYRFFNPGQPNRYKIKRQSKLTKSKVILLRKRLEMPKCRGYLNPQEYGSPLLICLFAIVSLIQGSRNDRRLKGEENLQTLKLFLLRKGLETAVEICQNVGDNQILMCYGYPLIICFFVVVSLIQGSRRLNGKANLQKP